jgi:hypothetical protein
VKRLVLGRAPDGSTGIDLRDSSGTVRAVLAVQPDGTPSLRFFDSAGKVAREWTADQR